MRSYIPCRTFAKIAPAFYGSTSPTPPTPPAEYVPFTIIAKDGDIYAHMEANGAYPTLYYRKNGGEWTLWDYVNENIGIEENEVFQLSGIGSTISNDENLYTTIQIRQSYQTGKAILSGHLNSLINQNEDPPLYAFYRLFNDQNSVIVDASNLIFPSGTYNSYSCKRMFENCTSLTAGPTLPSLSGNYHTYQHMFYGCNHMVSSGPISAKFGGTGFTEQMFRYCTALTAAPKYEPLQIGYWGAYRMFQGCTSLRELNINWSNLSAIGENGFMSGFQGCTALLSVSGSVGTSDMNFYGRQSFQGMFQNCTSLVDASHLTFNPMDITQETTFGRCFRSDSALTGAPNLPATGLVYQCYNTMFRDCTSLKDAPYLPAQTPAHQCYNHMFNGCTSLTGVHVELTSWGENFQYGSTASWLLNTAANGTFTKPAALSEEYGPDRIPNGWTVINQ